ncbi:MAG: AMP-binding protein, partial [Pseudomonadota bacterium]
MIDLFSPVERNAAFHPDNAAIHFEGETLTYQRLAARVRAVAEDLAAHGVARGDRVVVLAENHPDTLVLLHACARLGAIMAPLNWRLALDELAYAVTHADPKVIAYGPGYGETAQTLGRGRTLLAMGPALTEREDGEGIAAGALEDDGLLVYTSGTTGRPKGALISQRALMWNAIQSHHMHQMTAADHVLTV